MKAHPSILAPTVISLVALVIAATGTGFAANDAATAKTVSACVVKKGKKKGQLRIVATKTKCKRSERKTNWNQKGVTGAEGVGPAGVVAFFALAACPAGWTEFTEAQGRYVVGRPSGGQLAKTVGTPLADGEDRPVGKHAHAVNDPGHLHPYPGNSVPLTGTNAPAASGIAHADDADTLPAEIPLFTDLATTGITIADSGAVAGTTAPYVQLVACRKS